MDKFPYCKLHVLYAFQPKNAKEEDQITEEDIPKFLAKKIKLAWLCFSEFESSLTILSKLPPCPESVNVFR